MSYEGERDFGYSEEEMASDTLFSNDCLLRIREKLIMVGFTFM